MSTQTPLPRILAHRGLVSQFQENTLASIMAAKAHPLCNGAEFDVFLTRDNEVVLFHDADMQRLTGIKACISDMTWAQLQAIPILASLEVDGGMRHYGKPQPIVKLRDVLTAVKGSDFWLDIELKAYDVSWFKRHVGRETAKIVRELGMELQCVLSSFNYFMLKDAINEHPDINVAAAYDDNMPLPNAWLNWILEGNVFGRWLHAHSAIAEYTLLDNDSIQKYHAKGMRTGSFTFFPLLPQGAKRPPEQVDEFTNHLQRLAKLGLDWIETDDVEAAHVALAAIGMR